MKRWSSWYKVQRLINKEKKRYPNQTIAVLPFEDELKEGFTSATGLHESILVKIIDGGQSADPRCQWHGGKPGIRPTGLARSANQEKLGRKPNGSGGEGQKMSCLAKIPMAGGKKGTRIWT